MIKSFSITSCILLVSFFVFEFTAFDILIQDYFYNFADKKWALDRDAVIPKLVFYDGIKVTYIVFILSIIISLSIFRHRPIVKKYKKGLQIVLLSCVLVPLLIASLKAVTNIPCPKNIEHYDGNYPYVTVLTDYPSTFQRTSNIKCYPAGHASGGFALMSLFFLFINKRNRRIALASTITIGWIVGSYKMVIGDHFFSHTLITMLLSWLAILLIAGVVQRTNKRY